MQTIEFNIDVVDLRDYNEMGADPEAANYELQCMADVCKQTLEVENILVYDPITGLRYKAATLTERDQATLTAFAVHAANDEFFGYQYVVRPTTDPIGELTPAEKGDSNE